MQQKQQDIVTYLHRMHTIVGNLQEENRKLKDEIHSVKQSSLTKAEAHQLFRQQGEVRVDTGKLEDTLYDRIKSSLPSLLPQKPSAREITPVQPISHVTEQPAPSKNPVSAPTPSTSVLDEPLSYSERLVLNILFSADAPLSYEQIGARLNKRPGTIKVYVNNLKKKKNNL